MTQQDQRAEQRDQRAEERAQRQEQRNYLMMDQHSAVFRTGQGIYQHLYDARMDPQCPMLTPYQFMQSCMWPGDMPVYSRGVEHTVALMMTRRGQPV